MKDKLDLGFEYLGEHQVKNIKDPVRVYRVLMDSDALKPLVEEQLELPDKPSIAVLPFDKHYRAAAFANHFTPEDNAQAIKYSFNQTSA